MELKLQAKASPHMKGRADNGFKYGFFCFFLFFF